MKDNGLRAALDSLGGSLTRWTVMGESSDPFRMDKPANHRDAGWLAETMARLGHSTPQAALRYQHAAAGRDQVIAEMLSRLAGGG